MNEDKDKNWTFKEGTPNVPRNEQAVIKDFVQTNTPNQARQEIHKFLEAAGLVLTQRQLKVLNAMLKHYKNVSTTQVNQAIMKANDELRDLKIKYGEIEPH